MVRLTLTDQGHIAPIKTYSSICEKYTGPISKDCRIHWPLTKLPIPSQIFDIRKEFIFAENHVSPSIKNAEFDDEFNIFIAIHGKEIIDPVMVG